MKYKRDPYLYPLPSKSACISTQRLYKTLHKSHEKKTKTNKDTEGLEFKSPDIPIKEPKWKTEFWIWDQNSTNSLVLHISEAFQPLFLQGIYVLFHQLRRIHASV